MSKSFGMAGWRVGYIVYPSWASADMIKIQDTLPTHACTASQRIALAALEGEGEKTANQSFSSAGCGRRHVLIPYDSTSVLSEVLSKVFSFERGRQRRDIVHNHFLTFQRF